MKLQRQARGWRLYVWPRKNVRIAGKQYRGGTVDHRASLPLAIDTAVAAALLDIRAQLSAFGQHLFFASRAVLQNGWSLRTKHGCLRCLGVDDIGPRLDWRCIDPGWWLIAVMHATITVDPF